MEVLLIHIREDHSIERIQIDQNVKKNLWILFELTKFKFSVLFFRMMRNLLKIKKFEDNITTLEQILSLLKFLGCLNSIMFLV